MNSPVTIAFSDRYSDDAIATEGRHLEAEAEPDIDGRLLDLMSHYERPLYRFLLVLTGNREVALDCAQDAFVRAYETLRTGKTVNRQWLYKVARNRAMDEFRRRRWEKTDLVALEGVTTAGPAESVAMQQAFSLLPPEERALLYLLAVEGLSAGECAASLGTNAAVVRMRAHRARQRLRKLYGGTP